MKSKTTRKEHDEIVTVDGREYRCRFRPEANGAYHVTCAALPALFAYAADLPSARVVTGHEIEALIAERERRYEEGARRMLEVDPSTE